MVLLISVCVIRLQPKQLLETWLLHSYCTAPQPRNGDRAWHSRTFLGQNLSAFSQKTGPVSNSHSHDWPIMYREPTKSNHFFGVHTYMILHDSMKLLMKDTPFAAAERRVVVCWAHRIWSKSSPEAPPLRLPAPAAAHGNPRSRKPVPVPAPPQPLPWIPAITRIK